jgi:hypothetical protein
MTEAVHDAGNMVAENNLAAAQAAEKLLPQSQVNDLVGHAKKDAFERGKQAAMAELQSQKTAQPAASQPMLQQSMGGMAPVNPDDIRRMIAEEGAKQAQMQMAQKVAHEFTQKITAAKSRYPDMDQALADLDLVNNPHLVHLTNSVDNTADVLHDLWSNPEKIAMLNSLGSNPNLQIRKIQSLSGSIKANQQAANAPTVNEPLSHLKPSPIGLDSGSMTVEDWRNHPDMPS